MYANQHVSKVLLGDENENENVAEIVTCKE